MSDRPHPEIADAPGLTWKPNQNGWEARWRPRQDLVKRGYSAKRYRLWAGMEPSEADKQWVSDRCNALQAEMLTWGRGGLPVINTFNGALRSLVAAYQTDPDSPYRKKRYRTRLYYDRLCSRLLRDHIDEQIQDIKARTILRWHEEWSAGDKVSMGHAMIGMLRTLAGFGATILENDECARLSAVLSKMRFEMPKARVERITAEQVVAIRVKAHETGLPSVALAQAFQFELTFRQKDVIGEWVPIAEPGASDVTSGDLKWLRGIRWSEIDDELILRHTTSKRQKDIEVDLKLAPMVIEELSRSYPGLLHEDPVTKKVTVARSLLPSSGPIIISEVIGRPYVDHAFRRNWRIIATACGIPKAVWNMDSRAGAITEATDLGADIEDVRHAATHSTSNMTQRYSRGSAQKVAKVMQLRAANRNKP